MSAQVDVLADLKQARAALSQNATYPADVALARNAIDRAISAVEFVLYEWDALLNARAAIAELIAADREYDDARARLNVPMPNGEVDAALDKLEAATARRASALAAVGGSK